MLAALIKEHRGKKSFASPKKGSSEKAFKLTSQKTGYGSLPFRRLAGKVFAAQSVLPTSKTTTAQKKQHQFEGKIVDFAFFFLAGFV